jgi:MFS family permease
MASAVTGCENKENFWNKNLLLISVISALMVICVTGLEFVISPVLGKTIPLVADYFHVIWLMSIYGAVTLIGQVVSSWFYIRKKYKTPIFISAVNFSFAIPAKFLSYSTFGLVGLIVSTTVYHSLNVFIMLFFILRKK